MVTNALLNEGLSGPRIRLRCGRLSGGVDGSSVVTWGRVLSHTARLPLREGSLITLWQARRPARDSARSRDLGAELATVVIQRALAERSRSSVGITRPHVTTLDPSTPH